MLSENGELLAYLESRFEEETYSRVAKCLFLKKDDANEENKNGYFLQCLLCDSFLPLKFNVNKKKSPSFKFHNASKHWLTPTCKVIKNMNSEDKNKLDEEFNTDRLSHEVR